MKSMAAISEITSNNSVDYCQIHPTAVIDPSVQLAESVVIHANVVIERNVRIGRGSVIQAGCYIGEDCVVGDETVLHPFVTLREKTQIGNHVVIESGVVIGSDGFGYAKQDDGVNYKVPQVGYVVVKDNVHIGPNSTIDRATLGSTTIDNGAEIGALVQVGHNVAIGEKSTIGDGAGICGSCKIGAQVSIGQSVGMVGHIQIGDGAEIKDGSGVSKDIANGAVMVGAPAMTNDQYTTFRGYVDGLSEFVRRLNDIEEKLKERNGSA